MNSQPEPTKTAAQLLHEVIAADPEGHAQRLARAYGLGPTEEQLERREFALNDKDQPQ